MKNHFSELFLSKGVNYYSEDLPLTEILGYLGMPHNGKLFELGSYVSDELIELLDYIDHNAKPVLYTWGVTGNRMDYVRLSPEHSRALIRLQDLGVIRDIFGKEKSVMGHFVSGYIISDSGIFCTLTLTAQTAYGLDKYGSDDVKERFLPRFLAEQDPWFGATFYTEIQGGSDLGSNTTSAKRDGNRFYLTGSDKYFASDAGIADGAIVTARLPGSREGARGISVFFVPAYLENGERNYGIRRLKDKMGTIAVPTGEVEFEHSEGYMIGNPGDGIYIAMEILTISRIDDAIAAVGIARKALWEAVRYAEQREAFGRKIIDQPLMMRDLVEMESELEAATVVSLFAAKMFDSVMSVKPPYNPRYQLARMMSNIAKNMASETSSAITRYAMEVMGGIGFLEEFPMAKFHRDSIVTSIWEGTSNIQALEFLEVLAKKDGITLFFGEIEDNLSRISNGDTAERLRARMRALKEDTGKMLGSNEPQFYAKDLLIKYGELIASVYMSVIAEKHHSNGSAIGTNSRLYTERHISGQDMTEDMVNSSGNMIAWMRKSSR